MNSAKNRIKSVDADIKIPNTGHIPESYIPSPEERLKLHSALATAEHIHETRSLLDQWEIEYGHLPQELRQLVYARRISESGVKYWDPDSALA